MKTTSRKSVIGNHKIILVYIDDARKSLAFYVPAHVNTDNFMSDCMKSYDKYLEHGKKAKKLSVCNYAIKWIAKYYQGIEIVHFEPWAEYEIVQSNRANKIVKSKRNSRLRKHQDDLSNLITPESFDDSSDSI